MQREELKMTNKAVLGAVAALLILVMVFFSGYKYYSHTHPITASTDTIMVYDTVVHEIPVDKYIVKVDTVKVPEIKWDTVIIEKAVQDYYNTYRYDRSWSDSTISVNFSDFISRNRIESSTLLNYKLLKPQTTIINKIEVNNYSTYLGIGLDTDFEVKNPNINLTFTSKNYGLKLLYYPKQESFGFGASYNIIRLK